LQIGRTLIKTKVLISKVDTKKILSIKKDNRIE